MMNMSEDEVGRTSYGMMCDLIACMSIYKGGADQKARKKTYDEIMRME